MKTQTQTKPKTFATTLQAKRIEAEKELKSLKKQINDGHEVIEQMVSNIKKDGNKVLTEAILEGNRLLKVKKLVPFGSFNRWIKENCKSISTRTAQRYMALATRKAELLTTDVGLRKAYALVGIIKEDTTDSLIQATDAAAIQQSTHTTKSVEPVKSLAEQAAQKARNVKQPQPMIQKDDLLSRAKYLANELTNELTGKINNELIVKSDARQIIEPLIQLTN